MIAVQGELPLSVAGLLNSLGLGKYAIHFQAEEVSYLSLYVIFCIVKDT